MDILLYESLQNHWISQDPEKLKWWIDLHWMADERGEVHMSLSSLVHRWNAPKTTVQRFLKKLCLEPIGGTKVEQQVEQITITLLDSYKDGWNTKWNKSGTAQEKDSSSFSPTPPLSSSQKEINNNNNNNAHTRERVAWNEEREYGFQEQFRAEGRLMASARKLGCDCYGISAYLEKFMAHCQTSDLGHEDIGHFGSHFCKFVEREKLKPLQPHNSNSSVLDWNKQIAQDLGLIN